MFHDSVWETDRANPDEYEHGVWCDYTCDTYKYVWLTCIFLRIEYFILMYNIKVLLQDWEINWWLDKWNERIFEIRWKITQYPLQQTIFLILLISNHEKTLQVLSIYAN